MEWIFTLDTLPMVAQAFWQATGVHKVFAFHGDMGAGKTTVIHALCEAKAVQDVISSPTFSLINEYHYAENGRDQIIYHMDLYRIKSEEEALQAGIEDCLYSGHICLVEWPEKAAGLMPAASVDVQVVVVDPQTRCLRITYK